ncbi:MAG: lectin-like protein, partial [Bacteroidales bacterium]|nr:lectin-like protein [Bacteroidales bacterium]
MRPRLITVFVLAALLGWLGGKSQNNTLSMDGTNDQVTISGLSINGFSGITFEAWVYPRSFNLQATDDYISNIVADENTGALLRIGDNDPWGLKTNDVAQFVVITSSGLKKCNGTTQLPANQWHHLAGTYDGTSVKLYVNGVLERTEAHTGTLSTTTSEIWLGGAATARFLDGLLDEVRIWSGARTESEIRKNMYRELPYPAGESNLVAYYKLNSTSGTTATDSKGSYNGTLTNMSGNEWETSSALFGPKNLLDFDGTNDYVNISNLHVSGSTITVEAWVYLREFGHPSLDANIANLLKGGDENIVLRIGDGGQPNNMPQWVVKINNDHKRLNANARISLNTWYHLAGVYDGQEMKLYINGKLDKSQSQTGTLTTTAQSFGLGGIDRYLNGQMDEIRIWNDARTAEEIRENMCKTLTGNEENLVAYYSCDNSRGNTLPDLSGNGNNGTLTNMDGNTDWVASSAYNTWLNTSSSSWTTASNWSRGSAPVSSDNVGVYSYTGGANATLSGSPTVDNLVLGASSSITLSSGIAINGNLIPESDMDLNGQTITMGSSAYLIEEDARIYGTSGQLQTTRNLSNINENVAGLGTEISTSANMGSTTITRTHAANSSPASIKRRYNIAPTNNSGLNATLVFHYNDNELNGLAASSLELYRSTDGGTNWADMNGSINTFHNTITLGGIDAFSLWTAMEAEDVNPPILETQNPVHAYVQNAAAITVAPYATVTTANNIENATVSISPIVSGDVLSVSNLPEELSSSWDNSTKILSISGTGSATDYQTALRNVKFETSSITEDTRTIDFILGAGVGLMIDGEQHFYEVIDMGVGNTITWNDARSAALAKRFGLAQGYLATVTSQNENDYLAEKVSADTWIGAADSEIEGIWRWIDGPEAGTQFWKGDLNAGTSSTTNYGSLIPGEYA